MRVVVRETEKNKLLENPGSSTLLTKLGGADAGLPFFAFLDAKGEVIVNSKRPVAGQTNGRNIGHPFQPQEIEWFITMIKKAAPRISRAQTKTIEDWLKSQKT